MLVSNNFRFKSAAIPSHRRLNFLFLPSGTKGPSAPRSWPGPAVTSQFISWKPLTSRHADPQHYDFIAHWGGPAVDLRQFGGERRVQASAQLGPQKG